MKQEIKYYKNLGLTTDEAYNKALEDLKDRVLNGLHIICDKCHNDVKSDYCEHCECQIEPLEVN